MTAESELRRNAPGPVGLEIRSLGNMLMRLLDRRGADADIKSVTGTNRWILIYLFENKDKDIYQKDIEKKFCITRSTASKVISLMEKKDFIERRGVNGDARLKKLMLTQRTENALSKMRENAEWTEMVLTEGLSPSELESFCRVVQRMKANIKEELEK